MPVTDLWYDETGSGAPLVLLHQGVVDSRIWNPVVPLLADRYRVIRYDQRGFGRSPMWEGRYSPVEDLMSVLDATGVERTAVVGASQGGRIALDAALERPERLSAVVLVAGGLPGLTLEGTPDQETRWEAAEASGDYAAMAELDMEIWAPLGVDDELRAMFVENAEASNAEDPATKSVGPDRLPEIAVPTLVITGTRDVAAINEVGALFAREIPGAKSAVIGDADHVVPWRAPGELAALIVEFLR